MYFCWIGGFGDYDVFYYWVQSFVILVEFDYYLGVFLMNKELVKFYIYMLFRMLNGGDYGMVLRGLVKEGVVEQRYFWELQDKKVK